MYQDRAEAGRILAALPELRQIGNGMVLALPRGGVAVAAPIAQALGLPLGVILVRKVGLPRRPELAIAAIAGPDGEEMVVNEDIARLSGLSRDDIAALAEPERAELRRRRTAYAVAEPDLSGRTAIVVDDGLATGATARAAVHALRRQHPARIVLAVPVASPEALAGLRPEVDAVICPLVPRDFIAVGAHYRDFPQLSDAEVIALLHPKASSPGGRIG